MLWERETVQLESLTSFFGLSLYPLRAWPRESLCLLRKRTQITCTTHIPKAISYLHHTPTPLSPLQTFTDMKKTARGEAGQLIQLLQLVRGSHECPVAALALTLSTSAGP